MTNSRHKSYKPLNIRHENIKQLIKLLKNSKRKLSRADIARELSLSTPSVSSIVNVLIDSDIIIETDDENIGNNVGRKPILLKLNEDCGYLLGVLISEKKLTIALANYLGEVIKEESFYYKDNNKKCLGFLIDSIEHLLKNNQIDLDKLLSISISFPGVYDHDEQEIKFAPHSGDWQNEPIISRLNEEYNCQVKMENNVNTAVLGEKWQGKIAKKNNAVYLKLGNGIAAGIIINGQLYRGYNSLAGEIGFSVTSSKQLTDKITDSGSFEQRFNTDTMLEEIRKEIGIEVSDFNELKTIVKDNPELSRYIDNVNQNVKMLLINLISILNPEVIVIGGEYSQIIDNYIVDLKSQILKNVPFAAEILVSELEDEVYVLGAIANSLQNLERELIKKYFME
ncbi:putative NBD/HSP70 family sugar kinase [Halanaerobium saccharolyticum]|uniref:Putative NBD/HSP70 family sugar kinase n=1 Tax=Halanaerobium saccharolyticum TaxID=43595 RepID=A0A4V3CFL2_9FIRM|nr:ROK family protein [Halanaerobium saccharolyticum]TDO94192.1 putative NBD/HSP70 family sugar kinase [Halanaerobium saccharolyticum]